LSSLPVLGSSMPNFAMPGMPQPPQRRPWLSFQELRDDFDLREIQPQTDAIDPDIDALILLHPKDLPETTLFALDQFVLRGGRLLAFLDPLSIAETESQMPGQDPYGLKATGSNLDRLFKAWGVSFDSASVLADWTGFSLRMSAGCCTATLTPLACTEDLLLTRAACSVPVTKASPDWGWLSLLTSAGCSTTTTMSSD
jgi:hypothetical protein